MEFDSKKYWQMDGEWGYQFTLSHNDKPFVVRLPEIQTVSPSDKDETSLAIKGHEYLVFVKEDFETVRTILARKGVQ